MRSMPLFSEADHPNTLAAADNEGLHLWVLLHNLGEVGPIRPWYLPVSSLCHTIGTSAAVGADRRAVLLVLVVLCGAAVR